MHKRKEKKVGFKKKRGGQINLGAWESQLREEGWGCAGLILPGWGGGLQVKAAKARELGESSDSEKTCFKDHLYVVLVVQPSENSGSPKPPDSLVHEH